MFAVLRTCGISPESSDFLQMRKSGVESAEQHCRRSMAGNLSGPAAAVADTSPIARAMSPGLKWRSSSCCLVPSTVKWFSPNEEEWCGECRATLSQEHGGESIRSCSGCGWHFSYCTSDVTWAKMKVFKLLSSAFNSFWGSNTEEFLWV